MFKTDSSIFRYAALCIVCVLSHLHEVMTINNSVYFCICAPDCTGTWDKSGGTLKLTKAGLDLSSAGSCSKINNGRPKKPEYPSSYSYLYLYLIILNKVFVLSYTANW